MMMRSPSINELPEGSSEIKGWPWTEESFQMPIVMENGAAWPKISIVTPSYNQGRFIEETIRSVLLQGYPNYEYIVIDGGSTDETIKIIEKYSRWISYWVSEPDKGQSHALNKGFRQASGDIYGYINSDDFYERNAFASVAGTVKWFGRDALLTGVCRIQNESHTTRLFHPWWPDHLSHYLEPFGSTFAQPASFWSKELYHLANGFDESLHYAFDREFFLKLGLMGVRPTSIDQILACYRDHRAAKTRHTVKFYEETVSIVEKYGCQCGLSEKEIRRKLRKIKNDISYFNTFAIWKKSGRLSAMRFFGWYMIQFPDFLIDRKVLGLARRLLMFRASDVAELRNITC